MNKQSQKFRPSQLPPINFGELSLSGRFDPQFAVKQWWAPISFGCPAMLFGVDYSIFKKTDVEKGELFTRKMAMPKTKHHKFVTQFKGSF